jgi:signal transduction histidine kinase
MTSSNAKSLSQEKRKQVSFSRNLFRALLLLGVIACVFLAYASLEKRIDRANERRLESILLVDELRQSSDDLSRMVRTYTVTGNPIYKEYFREILDIRDGKIPRPDNYQQIYWDFVTSTGRPVNSAMTPAVPLLDLMRQAGFTEEEFHLLASAKASSDALTTIEFQAMKLMEASASNAEASRAEARLKVHDQTYHDAKAGIMSAINAVYLSMDRRTREAVHEAEINATRFRVIVTVLGLWLSYLLWRTYKDLRETLGGTVDAVYAQIARLGHNDLSETIHVTEERKDSLLGWLAQTQANLREINSQRDKAEEALQREHDLLETRVVERTEELSQALDHLKTTQDDLIQSERLASLGSMVAGVSHELNTPIGNAVTVASALVEQAKSLDASLQTGNLKRSELSSGLGGIVAMAQLIDRAVNRAATLLSSFKQVAVDQTSERRREFDLRVMVEDVITSLHPELKRMPWQIENEIPTDIVCDSYPGPLEQILTNLIRNAALHAFPERESGIITLAAICKNKRLELAVSDNGIGMDTVTSMRVFDPFFTTKLGKGGSGLGLSISHRLATTVLAGELTVSSSLGCGSTFTLVMPIRTPGRP